MGSPVSLAGAAWIFFMVTILVGRQVAANTSSTETQALLAFRSSLEDPGNNLWGWKAGSDPCDDEWTGVICGAEPGEEVQRVTELRLVNLKLGGQLVDELGDLGDLQILDVMWNNLNGSIPASIGKLAKLELLLLNGNQLTGKLPTELGGLASMNRIQIDENQISGPIPDTFANLTKIRHFHMNNNSLSGPIPDGLGSLPDLVHVLLDNNRLNGTLPPDLASAPSLLIIQLDNNKFTELPLSYTQVPTLLKLSMRNCGLQGSVPDLSSLTKLGVVDLSGNNLTGEIPSTALPVNLTGINLSNNRLNGSVPESIGALQGLRFLQLSENQLSGDIPSNLGTGASFSDNATQGYNKIILDFQNNSLSLASNNTLTSLQGDSKVELWMGGNPVVCPAGSANSNPICRPTNVSAFLGGDAPLASSVECSSCEAPYMVTPADTPSDCRCAIPVTVWYRLKSPGFEVFDLYELQFQNYIARGIEVEEKQVKIRLYNYEPGPRINITFDVFPRTGAEFNNQTEVDRLYNLFFKWEVPDSDLFGPYEIINFRFPPAPSKGSSGLSGGAIAGIVIAGIVVTAICAAGLMFFWMKKHGWDPKAAALAKRAMRRVKGQRPIKVAGVKAFTYQEMVKATENFNEKRVLGQGGYGKVYFGTLEDGTMVAVKRAGENSLQGAHEFETEIELMSRVHHRNLVGLVGYCQDEGEFYSQGEQMLVYEYVPNGNLRHHLDKFAKVPLDFVTRLRVALGSARGIQYLHTQADPPIFHRDIKAANILLDEKFNARVSDFGLSKLAPTDVNFEGLNEGHVTTVVKGTPGYLDPEYFLTHKLTDKSDVYSFGVVMLELITGMHPISQGKNLIREVHASYTAGEMKQIVDFRMGAYPGDSMDAFIKLALTCCNDHPNDRPSMTDVLHELDEIWKETPYSDMTSGRHADDLGGEQELLPLKRMDSHTGDPLLPGYYNTTLNASSSGLVSGTNINIVPR